MVNFCVFHFRHRRKRLKLNALENFLEICNTRGVCACEEMWCVLFRTLTRQWKLYSWMEFRVEACVQGYHVYKGNCSWRGAGPFFPSTVHRVASSTSSFISRILNVWRNCSGEGSPRMRKSIGRIQIIPQRHTAPCTHSRSHLHVSVLIRRYSKNVLLL